MSDFGRYKRVKIRKPHICVYCGRKVHIGNFMWNFSGLFEGDFQNWYSCEFCDHNVVPTHSHPGEYISGDEFGEWFEDSDFYACPDCGRPKYPKHNSCRFTDGGQTLTVECHNCLSVRRFHVPFTKEHVSQLD